MKKSYAIIPDIHGDYRRLQATLRLLGCSDSLSGRNMPPEGLHLIFLGDFIDGGTDNAAVINEVRQLCEAGVASAIMGNHEFNAILYQTCADSSWLRKRSAQNKKQHSTFLDEFPANDDLDYCEPRNEHTKEALDWFLSLPLYLDFPDFRVVHAQYDQTAIDRIDSFLSNACLTVADLPDAANIESKIGNAIEVLLKGSEIRLPDKVPSFRDKTGIARRNIRIKWWGNEYDSLKDLALSIPPATVLPDIELDERHMISFYGADEKPVFFGHYKMKGNPQIQSKNALCLDFPSTPCVYLWCEGDTELKGEQLLICDEG